MQYLKRFLSTNSSTPLPYTTKEDTTLEDSATVDDLTHMSKAEVWQFYQVSVNECYKGDSPPSHLLSQVLEEVVTGADIEEKIAQLERMQQILTHGLSLEVMDHYDQLGEM